MYLLTLLCFMIAFGASATAVKHGAVISSADGTFENPSSRVRPRFRYWLPDPGVDKASVAKDIKDAGDLGAGGVEFLPFYGYGGSMDAYIPEANWSKNGFGSPAFLNMFRTALEAHKENGMVMDFALGPNQGQGVPADIDDNGLQWDLASHSLPVPVNGSFTDTLPGWGDGDLVALVSARVLSDENVTISGPSFPPPEYTSYSRLTISNSSMRDLTAQVSESGRVSVELGAPINSTRYQLFAFYERKTLAKNLQFPYNNAKTIFDNGSYIVDHFSSAGARTVENFWKHYILKDGVENLLKEVGNYAWEDSMEIISNTTWTPGIPAKFEDKYGYSIRPFLPLIMWGNNNINIQGTAPGKVKSVLDTKDAGEGYINDYRALLQDCYGEYLQELQRWIHEELGLQTSSQVSYNMPMDAAATVPFSDAPECESLQWNNSVDGYRQYTGAAHLVGKRVISNELGAVRDKAFQFTIPDLLWTFNRAIAGGVNQAIIHGQTYSGNYYNTTWPGYTPFSYLFSDLFSEKQPSWKHGLSEIMEYMARVQHLQQNGVPKTDIAIYNKVSASDPEFDTLYPVESSVGDGWTYEYLTADNFLLPQAYVERKLLAPDGPRYKAVVLPDSSNLTIQTAQTLRSFADAGLPIIFSGDGHVYYPSGNSSSEAATLSAVADLLNAEHVYSCESHQLSQLLTSISLDPQIRTEINGTLHLTWREDMVSGFDYAFLFCDGVPCRGKIHVSSTKRPYIFNPWTGDKYPALVYSLKKNKTVLPIDLQGNQTFIIVFSDQSLQGSVMPAFHATEAPSNLLGYIYDNEKKLELRLSQPKAGQQRFTLSTGQSLSLANSSSSLPIFELRNWTLTAEHWEAPENISDASIIANKHNTTHSLPSLSSWTNIPGLQNASGVGYYAASFPWQATNGSEGACIRFSRVLHAVTVYVNGNRLPPLDYNAAEADIGSYLLHGENHLLVIAPTTMWNYLRSIFSQLRHVGQPPLLEQLAGFQGTELPPKVDVGLVGTVSIIPYKRYLVEV